LQSFPASFFALHELLGPAEAVAPASAGFGVLLGPQADNARASSASESFMDAIFLDEKTGSARAAQHVPISEY
jgi:hypothetical protein